ncbi:hypothetical protein B0F90DRAFT_1748770 [Multifurca ochricompacta]|uniref:Uncharacterized protein n=1 Tax=Multifurca ochricompacta TaxID=376703 RepID=A0AAD4QL55_9AGAM|nr:hypothetical protein B0F90DRAFT_1748770 [Multifurca ochricompacta]
MDSAPGVVFVSVSRLPLDELPLYDISLAAIRRPLFYWREPGHVAAEYFALLKFVHVLGGVYIWEFISNLDFECAVIRGKRKFNWPFLLYLGCRWCTLIAIIFHFLGFDGGHRIDCQFMGYFSFTCASALIVLRIVAFWARNTIAIILASSAWLVSTGTYIYSTVTVHAIWNGSFCEIQHTDRGRISIFSTLASDLVLLALMLVGLLLWNESRQGGGIWGLLYKQGLAWVVIVTLAEVPAAVFITLNLNVVIMALGASSIYRGLADYTALKWSTDDMSTIGVRSSELGSGRLAGPRESYLSGGYPSLGTQGPGSAMLATDVISPSLFTPECDKKPKAFRDDNIA